MLYSTEVTSPCMTCSMKKERTSYAVQRYVSMHGMESAANGDPDPGCPALTTGQGQDFRLQATTSATSARKLRRLNNYLLALALRTFVQRTCRIRDETSRWLSVKSILCGPQSFTI